MILPKSQGGFVDTNHELSDVYDVCSYKGIETLPNELRMFDPFFMAAFMDGSSVTGLSFGQALTFGSPKFQQACAPIVLKDEYEKAVNAGLLRFFDECRSTSHGIVTGIYFPTEKLLERVLEKKKQAA